jgi:hypothetical protein
MGSNLHPNRTFLCFSIVLDVKQNSGLNLFERYKFEMDMLLEVKMAASALLGISPRP